MNPVDCLWDVKRPRNARDRFVSGQGLKSPESDRTRSCVGSGRLSARVVRWPNLTTSIRQRLVTGEDLTRRHARVDPSTVSSLFLNAQQVSIHKYE